MYLYLPRIRADIIFATFKHNSLVYSALDKTLTTLGQDILFLIFKNLRSKVIFKGIYLEIDAIFEFPIKIYPYKLILECMGNE